VDMKLEVMVVHVSDVDRAKRFYGVTSAVPGSVQGLHLVVFDVDAARAELVGRGAEVGEVFHDVGGVFHHSGTEGREPPSGTPSR
jgi:hypothetical protein